jgi:hypothetical protein
VVFLFFLVPRKVDLAGDLDSVLGSWDSKSKAGRVSAFSPTQAARRLYGNTRGKWVAKVAFEAKFDNSGFESLLMDENFSDSYARRARSC